MCTNLHTMNLLKFFHKFPSEEKCLKRFVEVRLEQGITCRKCEKQTKHYWLRTVKRFECKECKCKTSYMADTMMHKSKIGLQKWFILIHLMTSIKKSMSALEVSRQLDTRYQSVYDAMHKIRLVMGKRDERYKLGGEIEIDEAFFTTVDFSRDTDEVQKRGVGSQRKTRVLVLVESEYTGKNVEQAKLYNRDSDHKKNRKLGYAKMIVMDADSKAETINYEIQKHVKSTATAISDKATNFVGISKIISSIKQMKVDSKDAMKKLPWVHTVISNTKRMANGIHHSVNKDYLQNYLNEFCYKLNRRNFQRDMFDGMLTASVCDTWF